MNKALITGGTGFVGSWLQRTVPKETTACMLNKALYRKFFWDIEPYNYIIHCAPVSPDRALACARHCGARLLYVSSGIVYHPENDTQYRQDKMRWEKDCITSGVDVVIARLFTFYGDGLDDGKAWTQFTKAAQASETIRIHGDGKTIRSYMHGADMARWLWAILLRGESGQAYDVGSDAPLTMLELARTINDKYDNKSEIIVENRAPDAMPVYLPENTAKTRRLL